MTPPPPAMYQPAPFGDRAERSLRTDPLLTVGIVTTSIGATLALVGIPPAVDGDGDTSVPLLLAGGLTAGTGLTMIAVGAGPVTTRRQSDDLLLAGGIVAGAGTTAIGSGAAWQNAGALGTGLLAGGSAAVAGGLVMMVTGAQDADARPRVAADTSWHPGRGDRVPRSPNRAAVGKAFTAVGVVAAAAGAVVTEVAWRDTGGWVMIYTGPLMGTGALLIGIGIPLWATGEALVPAEELQEDASPRRPRPAPRSPAVPEVAIGPGSFSARWAF